MKLIESKAEYIPQTDLYKHIELCGRTAYKSEDKITEDSAKGFVDRMIKSKHGTVLEHGTVYLMAKVYFTNRDIIDLEAKYAINPYSKVVVADGVIYITTNYRVIIENNWLDDMKYVSEPTEFHEKRYTIKFTGHIQFSKEARTHRPDSFVVESTRYCNYIKGKFGTSVSFMIPSWLTPDIEEEFKADCEALEKIYFKWINKGYQPQQAAYFLCQGTKASVCMTGFASDWRFFFDLRYYGETGKPHPDMELLAGKAREEFIKAGIWEDIMSKPSKFDK